MAIKNKVEIVPLTCINPTQGLEICPLDTDKYLEKLEANLPLFAHETTMVRIESGTIEELFVHHFQTDQLLVVKGSAVLVVLQNKHYQYILMSESKPMVVRIPPGIPHSAINLSGEPCIAINSIIRHGPPFERDYRPLRKPFPFDLGLVRAMLGELNCPIMR
ncbi:cupin domain-containing protein [Limnofasciculus baicalensis]|uniref:Cupin domain-containing protein n=1 Tax=Limnofasciculus baicalensis BBK-W-15 TaxID=2699891 RepID=A0AAE3GQV1_9CYAN|nr:cupin domain-containing protein [Limnofasciculus baicalensis]MCP2729041.1 cupin domain-containing protein [Limnofasciculus baicalensis BBK-W-15]